MSDPYRDEDAVLVSRLDSLLDQLERCQARMRQLDRLETQRVALEAEIDEVRQALEHRASRSSPRWVDAVRVASPCTESWGAMSGDDRTRHCARCDQTVFHLSAMTREEAERFLRDLALRLGVVGQGESACIRLYRRQDGTVLTSDCPVGVEKKRRKLRVLSALAGGLTVATTAMTTVVNHEMQGGAGYIEPLGDSALEIEMESAQWAAKHPFGIMAGRVSFDEDAGESIALRDTQKRLTQQLALRAAMTEPETRRALERQIRETVRELQQATSRALRR